MLDHSRRVLLIRIAVLSAIFVAAWFWTWEGPGLCMFHRLTGLDCPGCGMTRAFHQLSHGNLDEAMEFNLLSPFLFGTFLLVLLHDVVQLVTGWHLKIEMPKWLVVGGGYGLLVIVVAYGILRNVTSIP